MRRNAAPRSSPPSAPPAHAGADRARCSRPAPMSSASISATARMTTTGARYDAHPRRSRSETGRPIGVLADLQGPKLRLGTFEDGRRRARRRPALPPRSRSDARRCDARAAAASGDLRGARAGHRPAARRRQGAAQGRRLRPAISPRPIVIDRRPRSPTARASTCPNAVLPLSPLTEKDRADLPSPSISAPTGSRCPSCSGRRTSPRRAS